MKTHIIMTTGHKIMWRYNSKPHADFIPIFQWKIMYNSVHGLDWKLGDSRQAWDNSKRVL